MLCGLCTVSLKVVLRLVQREKMSLYILIKAMKIRSTITRLGSGKLNLLIRSLVNNYVSIKRLDSNILIQGYIYRFQEGQIIMRDLILKWNRIKMKLHCSIQNLLNKSHQQNQFSRVPFLRYFIKKVKCKLVRNHLIIHFSIQMKRNIILF